MTEDDRPSPDALLAALTPRRRGRLKIFLGAAPGVGKTCAALNALRRLQAEGADVLVGWVDSHGRAETAALTQGLPLLPRRPVMHRARVLEEFDLDAALARRPALILVDELAHSNAPGSRHNKRWRDVEELLAAGIDVHTTLNVQHLESLNDVILQMTKTRVRETVPDSVLTGADEIELIDISPEALLKRLADGKIYAGDAARRALDNFFQPSVVTALRELALRRTTEHVDDQLTDHLDARGTEGRWAAGERILVCIGPDGRGAALARAGRRLAGRLNASWVAAHVQDPHRTEDPADGVAAALHLTEQLGGDVALLSDADPARALLRFAQARRITRFIVGRRRSRGWRRWLRPSLAERLVDAADDVTIHVVAEEAKTAAPRAQTRAAHTTRSFWRDHLGGPAGYALAGLSVVAATGLGLTLTWALRHPPGLSALYLVAVLITAVRAGLFPSVLASFLSFLAYNFFFTAPYYTLAVSDERDLLALGSFLAAAVATSSLAGGARDREHAAFARAHAIRALFEFSRKLGATADLDGLSWALAHHLAATGAGSAAVLLAEAEGLTAQAMFPPDEELDDAAMAAALWSFRRGEVAGAGADTLPAARWRFHPLRTARRTLGVVGVVPTEGGTRRSLEADEMLTAAVDLGAVAIERGLLVRETAAALAEAEAEKLRGAMLASISHDLRTPLSSILGAATSLIDYGDALNPSARQDLLRAIQEEADRLNRFVGDLLDMMRLEGGALSPHLEPLDPAEIIGRAARRAAALRPHPIRRQIAPDAPMALGDFALLEQTLFNLLDNAGKFSPAGAGIDVVAHGVGDHLEILVQDQGVGVAPERRGAVFDKFIRDDPSAPGAGLGLAICRGFVQAMGGVIACEDRPDGRRGACFRLSLPAAPPSAAPPAPDADPEPEAAP